MIFTVELQTEADKSSMLRNASEKRLQSDNI